MIEERDLNRGTVGALVLKLLSERTMYGYELVRAAETRSQGVFAWKEGTLYPVLHKLENSGLIAGEWRLEGAKPRKYYTISRRGREVLAGEEAQLRKFAAALTALLDGGVGCEPA